MSDKSRFPVRIVSLLVGIGVLVGLIMLLSSAQWSAVAADTHWLQSGQEGPMSPDTPQAQSCTHSACHGQMEFNAFRHHVASGVSETDCRICHAEVDGNANHRDYAVQLLDPDLAGTLYTVTKFGGQRNTLTAADIASLTAFCYKCHDGNGAARLGASAHDPFGDGVALIPAIGTHSNQDFNGVEADFHVGCIQCHASHGSSNLAIIDSNIVIAPGVTGGPVTFTSHTGANSRDDGSGNGICVICHNSSSNPGYPMTNHSGGIHIRPSVGDQRSNDCTMCHPHEPDGNPTTQNGHMPATPTSVGLHGLFAQGGLWPIVGLGTVLLAFVSEHRKRSKN